MFRLLKPNPVILHKTRPQVTQEIQACIGCNECLVACPALGEPITIDVLNRETIAGSISPVVERFARACYQCGACVSPCPVGLHRDSMMMWLKARMLRADEGSEQEQPFATRPLSLDWLNTEKRNPWD